MRSLPLLIALALAFAPACAPPPNTSLQIVYDPCGGLGVRALAETTSPELAGVAAGLALWNATSSVQLHLDDADTSVPVRFADAPDPMHGVYDDRAGEVVINQRLVPTPDPMAITVAHELGHAMGLLHVPLSERPSLMNPGNVTLAPTAADVDSLWAVWSCR
jgi:hypothetical protein